MIKETSEQFKRKLGNKIAKRRIELGITQEQLANSIGKDKQFINRYENDGANPTAFVLKQLAQVLEISVDELLNV